jgi:hypothetical protein
MTVRPDALGEQPKEHENRWIHALLAVGKCDRRALTQMSSTAPILAAQSLPCPSRCQTVEKGLTPASSLAASRQETT